MEVVVERVVQGDARHHDEAGAGQLRLLPLRAQFADASRQVVEAAGAQHLEQARVAAAVLHPETEPGHHVAIQPVRAIAHHVAALEFLQRADGHQALGHFWTRQQHAHAEQAALQRMADGDQPRLRRRLVRQHHDIDQPFVRRLDAARLVHATDDLEAVALVGLREHEGQQVGREFAARVAGLLGAAGEAHRLLRRALRQRLRLGRRCAATEQQRAQDQGGEGGESGHGRRLGRDP